MFKKITREQAFDKGHVIWVGNEGVSYSRSQNREDEDYGHVYQIIEEKEDKTNAEERLRKLYTEVNTMIDEIESDDENMKLLDKAMSYWCSNYDICEGFKHALRITLEDQQNNHFGEDNEEDLLKLKELLK